MNVEKTTHDALFAAQSISEFFGNICDLHPDQKIISNISYHEFEGVDKRGIPS